jgi:hypothetical protein
MASTTILTRRQAAEKLAIGVRRLRDLESQGRLKPAGKKGERRVYTTAMIDRFLADNPKPEHVKKPTGRRVAKDRATSDGETAAKIFASLKGGETKIAIVIALRVHPDLVDELGLKYQRMLEQESGAARAPCVKCNHEPARFCGGCLA